MTSTKAEYAWAMKKLTLCEFGFWRFLLDLGEVQEIKIAELAIALNLSQPAVSVRLKNLSKKGFLLRERTRVIQILWVRRIEDERIPSLKEFDH